MLHCNQAPRAKTAGRAGYNAPGRRLPRGDDRATPGPTMLERFTETLSRRLVLGVLLGGLLLFTYAILHSFLVPVAWEVILAYATWPLHIRLRRLLRGRHSLAAGAMTLLLAAT